MRILVAFIITVVIYILLIWLYLISFRDIKPPMSQSNDNIIKIDIRNILSPKKAIKRDLLKKQKSKKKHNKLKKESKKIVVKKKIKKRDKPKVKKIKKTASVSKKKSFIPESEIIYIPNPIFKTQSVEGNHIAKIEKNSYPNRKIEKLYGKEFHSYTESQKRFIEQNLDEIHKITQNRLWQRGYPGGAVSARTGQEGTNIVSFYLHPNGDITDLRLKKRVGYRALDDNTIETIKSAYKDYPYPDETTKMIFYVKYFIFGY